MTTLEKLNEMILATDAVTSVATDPALWNTWRERGELLRKVQADLSNYYRLLEDLDEYIPDWSEKLERTYY